MLLGTRLDGLAVQNKAQSPAGAPSTPLSPEQRASDVLNLEALWGVVNRRKQSGKFMSLMSRVAIPQTETGPQRYFQ